MATNLNKEKFDILNFVNGYIISICGNYHKRIRNLLKNFSIKISSSAEGCNELFGTKIISDIQFCNNSAEGCVEFFGTNNDSSIGPITSSATGLLKNSIDEE